MAAGCALLVVVPVRAPGGESAARPHLAATYRAAADRLIGAALGSDRAYERLAELCDGIGHRFTGSAGLERAVAWGARTMRADGLDSVWLQPVKVPRWVRARERAVMVEPGPHELSILGLGWSVGTPPGGITADVVVVGSWDELDALPDAKVRGKIVLFDVPFTTYAKTVAYRSRGAIRAGQRGAVAALVRSVGPAGARTPHTGSMSIGYRDSGYVKIPSAAVASEDAALLRRLHERGRRVRVKLEMGARLLPDGISHNVIGELRGRERPDEVVLVSGHLDSWDVGQGAHDDGGGCVIAMEALRLMRDTGLRPRRTVRCVLWTNEENGVAGGKAYAADVQRRGPRHVAAIESDGGVERPVGFGFRLRKPGTETTDTVRTEQLAERMRPFGALLAGLGAAKIDGQGGGTDIGPLMTLGVPGVGHATTMERYFEWHHTPADMLDKVDPVELRKNAAAIAVMTWLLAEMPEPLVPDAEAAAR